MQELEPDSEFIARITYRYNLPGRDNDIIEYYTAADRKSIIRINGENIYKCRDIYTTRLLSNIDAYINGTEINLEW